MLSQIRSYVTFGRANWACIGFGMLMTFGSSLGQTYFVAVFNPHLREAFDLSHGEIGLYYSIGTLMSAFSIVWVGKLLDTIPLKRFTLSVYAALALACLFMVILPFGAALALGFYFLRFAGQGLMTQTGTTAIARQFDADRGKALGLTALGFSMGQAFLPFLGVLSAEALGWRTTWFLFSGFAVLAMLPAALWLLSKSDFIDVNELHRLDEQGDENDGINAEAKPIVRRQWTRSEMIRDPRFYMLIPVAISAPFMVTGIFWNQALLAETKGWSLEWVAASLSVSAISQFIATLAGGGAVDRWSALRVMPMNAVPLAVALAIIIVIDHPIGAPLMMVCFGISAGIGFTAGGSLWAELYGIAHLGAIKSLMSSIFIFSTAVVPIFMGVLSDAGVPLDTIATGFLAATIAAICLALTVKPDIPRKVGPQPAE